MHSGPLAFLRMYLFYARPWQQLAICGGVILVGVALIAFAGQLGGILLVAFGVVAGGPVVSRRIRARR